MLARNKFYDSVRPSLFYGTLNQSQVEGMETVLDMWEKDYLPRYDIAGLAYTFATNYWEARLPPDWRPRMQPVEEVGKGAGKPYGVPDPRTGLIYYGRGDVQLTWADNYIRLGKILGIPLFEHPELALDKHTSKLILVKGMIGGLYTSNAGPLERYFPLGGPYKWIEARRMVNIQDKAQEIADIAKKFHTGLLAAQG